jgi:succinate dehydrogenase / fumarate reductase membrane anchor subunit
VSLRTPLGKVLGLGSAKDGTEHFWAQRVSAMALLLLGIWFVVAVVISDNLAYADLVEFIAAPLNSILLSILSVVVAFHSYLGIQVIVEDYVHSSGIKIAALLLSRFTHILVAITAVYAILKIGISA